jgi:DNA polymerase-3 subunit delta
MVNPDASVFLFIGSEAYLKENALNKLRASLSAAPSLDLDYKIFHGSQSTAREILDHAATFPLFSSKKLIVIKEFDSLPKEDRSRIAEYLKAPARSTYVVIDAEEDDDVKEVSASVRNSKIMRFSSPGEGELSNWITKYLAAKGKSVETGAVDMLKDLKGPDLTALTQELEKLISFVGQRTSVNASDVETLVGKSAVESAFELGWAIGDKDVAKAMKVVSGLMLEGNRPHETIGLISWHLNRILKAKLLQKRGESASSISGILKIARRHQDHFFRQAGSFSLERIQKKMDVLLEADLDIKRTRFDPVLVLELAIVRLCLG